MHLREKFEIVSIECLSDKINSLETEELEIDKKYDFKAYDPLLGTDNKFEVDIYLVISNIFTNEQLLHLIGNVKVLTRPGSESIISDAINIHARLNYIYETIWHQITQEHNINPDILKMPYLDINVIEKMFEYFTKWGYYQ